MSTRPEALTIVYDGECPFCSRYVRVLRLRDAVGAVKLMDARQGGAFVEEVQRAGFDLNEGMVAEYAGKLYHGADCVHLLAMLSTESGFLNGVNAAIFRSDRLSKLLYPMLRFGRNLTLRLLGREKISNLG
jgi:predicted DCC family thiol-disulfide oxidoreductase YuxK